MTVHNKIKEGLAMAKPVITGDSPAVRLELTHGEHVYLCERANPRALADAILTLRAGPTLRAQLAQQGHRRFSEHFTVASIGQQMRTHLESLLVER